MAFLVVLEGEQRDRIDSISEPATGPAIGALLPPLDNRESFALRFIDPYGHTTFNQLQMDVFLEEWSMLRDRIDDPELLSFLASVAHFAEQVRNEPHLYLRFIGD